MDLQARQVRGADGQPVAPWLDKEAWWSVRAPRLGSSDVAAMLGRSEYSAPWGVYDRVVLGVTEDVDSADTRRGTKQEPVALQTFTERYGLQVEACFMIHHHEAEWIVSDVDGLIRLPSDLPDVIAESPMWAPIIALGGVGVVEAKAPRIARFYQYKEEGLPEDKVLQMQHHMMVTGAAWGVFVIYCAEYDDLVAFPVLRDEELCAWLLEAERRWWRDHVVAGVRPQRPAPEPPRWPAKVPGEAALRFDEEWMERAQLVAIRYHELQEAQAAYAETEAHLLTLLNAEDTHVAGGGVTVKRRTTSPQRRKDFKALAAALLAARKDGDPDAVLAIDPNDEAFTYLTTPSEKVEVVVTAQNPMEVMA